MCDSSDCQISVKATSDFFFYEVFAPSADMNTGVLDHSGTCVSRCVVQADLLTTDRRIHAVRFTEA